MRAHTSVRSLYSPVALVVLWELIVRIGLVDAAFLPSPTQITRAFVEIGPLMVLEQLGASLFRVFAGLFAAALVGIALGTWMARNAHVDRFFAPILGSIYSVPKSAFIPLLILWLGVGNSSTIVAVFLACLLPVVVYSFHGVQEVPRVLQWGAATLGGTRGGIIWRVYLPAASAQIFTGLRIALGFAFFLSTSAEMIASTSGLGKLIFAYGQGGNYDAMFAALAVLVAAAFAADQAFVRIRDRQLRWMPTQRANQAAA